MLNPFKEVDWNPDIAARRSFAKSLIVGFPCVAVASLLILRFKTGVWDLQIPMRIAGFGAAAGVIFYGVPAMAKPFYLVWYGLACCIGLVVGNLLLGGVFYVLVTGIALFMRVFRRDPLRRQLDQNAKTYWQDAEQPTDPRRYYRQF